VSTPAVQLLKKEDVPFEVVTYRHEERGAAFAARATGFALARIVKTLVVALDTGVYVLALVPGDRRLDLKKTAGVFSAKRAALADAATAQRLTGYLVGGISPFGTKRPLAAVMDTGLLEGGRVMINAGRRGMMLQMNPRDIAEVLRCRKATIAKPVR